MGLDSQFQWLMIYYLLRFDFIDLGGGCGAPGRGPFNNPDVVGIKS